MSEVITMATCNSKIADTRNCCEKNKLCTTNTSLHVLPWLSCHDLAMIMASVPCIMIYHDLDKGTMVNHDLARFTMIMASRVALF